MKYFTTIFLTIESNARKAFAHFPFIHAFLAGVGIVFVWRGIWETADALHIGSVTSIIIGVLVLGAIGLYLQTLVGNTIIINEVAKDKEMTRKTEKEVRAEVVTMDSLANKLDALERKIDSLRLHE